MTQNAAAIVLNSCPPAKRCGVWLAAAGRKVTTHGIVLPETKTQNVQVASVDADDIDREKQSKRNPLPWF